MSIGICRYEKCPKSKECLRFLSPYEEFFLWDFKNVCNEENNYKWFWKANQEIIIKEEGENSVEL